MGASLGATIMQADSKDIKRSKTSEPLINDSSQQSFVKKFTQPVSTNLRSGSTNNIGANKSSAHENSNTTQASSRIGNLTAPSPFISELKLSEVSKIAEERRRERMKALTRNLEVCDLLDMRNLQSVAEHAPKITSFLLEEECRF